MSTPMDAVIARLEAVTARLEAVATAKPVASGGPTLPNYGKSKGLPVAGASVSDLEYYRDGCLRTLNDPEKERFHAKERVLLAAIDAELKRQGVAPATQEAAPF